MYGRRICRYKNNILIDKSDRLNDDNELLNINKKIRLPNYAYIL